MKFKDSSLSVASFSDMKLVPQALTALAKLGFTDPTPIQSQAIPAVLAGADMVAVAQTGTGKTLAYALPIMTKLAQNPQARVLVLTPNRETADQVLRTFNDLNTENQVTLCLATIGSPEKTQVSQLKKNPRIIIATPGRLAENLRKNKLLLQGLEILVLDEADRLIDVSFDAQIKFIHSTLRGKRQTLMFAATFGAWADPIANLLMHPGALNIRAESSGKPVANLKQTVFFMTEAQKNNRLRDELRGVKGGIIVFAESQESCNSIGRFLEHHKFSSDFMHGDMKAGHRNRVLREFREEKIQILVTTDLLARGLDVPHVNAVVSYDLPYKGEDYLHRIGRTARAGREGAAITFVTPGDARTYRKMKPYLEGAKEETLSTGFQFDERD